MMDTTARDALSTSSGWFKSSYSGGANGCVELDLSSVPGYAGVRDSKLSHPSPVLVFPVSRLTAFIDTMKHTANYSVA